MKKLFFVLMIAASAISCDAVSEDNGTQYYISPIETATMASAYKVDSTSQIMIQYKRPTQCHIFNGFFYSVEGNTRTVAVEFAKLQQAECLTDPTTYEIPLNFKPTAAGTYTFKFWSGTNSQGVDTYIEEQAIVGQ